MTRFSDVQRWLIPRRGYLLVVIYSAVFTLSYWLAFGLRFDFTLPPEHQQLMWFTLPWVLAIKFFSAYFLGSFHGWLRYVTFHDLLTVVRASVTASFLIAMVDYFLLADQQIPRSVIPMDCAITILLVGGLRSMGRFSQEHLWPLINMHLFKRNGYRKALLVGANRTGVALVNQIHSHPRLELRVAGFLDPDASLRGSRLVGISVLGTPDDAAAVAQAISAKDVLVIAGTLPGKSVRTLMEDCQRAGLSLKIIPAVDDLVRGQNLFGPHGLRLRDVDINDVLRRDPVELDSTAVTSLLQSRVVMVTGAGGSIGSEICRQIVQFNPRAIVLVERAENNLFNIERELLAANSTIEFYPCIADVTDLSRMRQIFELHRPHVLFHAAAHKHVPMMESNPGEAIKNNVFGTKLVADLSDQYGLQSFVLISTDKAVNASSVMGLSKQLAERYLYAISQDSKTRFVVVRFGNVLGSVGSVVPIFQEQIRNGGPITVTHPEMCRYFMTIPEASQLVLQAGAMGKGGEIFVLEMGEPVKIVDLARDMIRLSGLSTDEIEIVFTAPRPGEKLFEELYFDEEETLPTPHPKLRVAYHRPYTVPEARQLLAEMWELAQDSDPERIRDQLRRSVLESGVGELPTAPSRAPSESTSPLLSQDGNSNGDPKRPEPPSLPARHPSP